MASPDKTCAYPNCCGSDGVDCCKPLCPWSPWYSLTRLLRTAPSARSDRSGQYELNV